MIKRGQIAARLKKWWAYMRHLIDVSDLSRTEWEQLLRHFENIIKHPGDYRDALRGLTLASLFYEPSTRTRLSFEAAMHRLGGAVFGFSDPAASSVSKGESLKDTVTTVSGYADVIVMRHPCEGAALAASLYSSIPVVNAGDGGHCHPTQTLTDLATLYHLRGGADGLRIGLCGDLKYGRTVHSLLGALCRHKGVSAVLVSAPDLQLPEYVRETCRKAGLPLSEQPDLQSALGEIDVLYMTRVQRERFSDPAAYERLKNRYILTEKMLRHAHRDLLIMHPLPRNTEISAEVDDDPRAVYFEQARLGMFIRMALLLELCKQPSIAPERPRPAEEGTCFNPNCIISQEPSLPYLTNGNGGCGYCDTVTYPPERHG